MPDQSREFNMPACLLAALASGSFARCHCDVFHFCSTRCLPLFFSTSSKTVLLRCSFGFHVDSNRASAHASNERRLSPSCDVRSIRIAIAVPCQEHQQKSLVSLFRAIAELSRYDAIICIFAVPAPVCPFGFRNS